MAHYKIPRYVHLVDEFPMTVTGKIRKVQMREESVQILGCDQRILAAIARRNSTFSTSRLVLSDAEVP